MFRTVHAATRAIGPPLVGDGLGVFARLMTGVEGLRSVASLVSSIIGVMTLAAGIWFFFNFLIGGIQWIGSGGDKHNLEQSQQRITNAFIGLIIVVAGWTILALASKFTGVDFLLADPTKLMQLLSP